MAVSMFPSVHVSGMGAGVKRALSESEDSEYSEDEGHYPTATLVLGPTVHSHMPEWNSSGCCGYVSSRGRKQQRIINPYFAAFLQLYEDDVIQDFLWVDSCYKLADKYLLAMVYVYFRRAALPIEQYNRVNFFTALYLANDIEEDEEDDKYEIFSWVLGEQWMSQFPMFLVRRDELWHRMGFRAIVSRKTCEEVMAMAPSHDIWQRSRPAHHGGAHRAYSQPPTPHYGRTSPPYCEYCAIAKCSGSSVSVGTLTSKQGPVELPTLGGPSPSTGLLVPPVFGMDLLDDIDCAQNKDLLSMNQLLPSEP